MNPATPITPVVALHDTDNLTDLAETWATIVDELAGMVETSDIGGTKEGRTLAETLGALHVVLDELTITCPTQHQLVALIHRVDRLYWFATTYAEISHIVHALLAPLTELHAVLVTELTALPGRAGA